MLSDHDHQLIREYLIGRSQEAFGRLMARHVDMVYSTSRRVLGDGHLAEDATQATFLILARRARSIRPNIAVGGWLYQAAYLTARNLMKMESRRRRREVLAARSRPLVSAAERIDEREEALDAALSRLSAGDRDVLVLRYLQDQSVEEVAAVLHASGAAVTKRLTRALARLRRLLGAGGAALSGPLTLTQPAPAHVLSTLAASIAGGPASGLVNRLVEVGMRSLDIRRFAGVVKVAALVSLPVVLAGVGLISLVWWAASPSAGAGTAAAVPTVATTTQASREVTVQLSDGNLSKWWIDPVSNHYTMENGELVVYNRDANGAGLHAEVGGMSWDNYRVTVEFLAETETSAGMRSIGGFPWNIQLCPNNTLVFCQVFGDGSYVAYLNRKRANQFTHVSVRRAAGPALNTWHKLELTAAGGRVTVALDDNVINEGDIPTGTAGMFGLLVNFASDARVRVRNMHVALLAPTAEQLQEAQLDAATNWENYKRRLQEQGLPAPKGEDFPSNKPGLITTLPPEVRRAAGR